MLHRFVVRSLLLCIVIVFSVLFGVELATTGIQQTGGQVPDAIHESVPIPASQILTAEELKQELEAELGQQKDSQQELDSHTGQRTETLVDDIASSAGNVIRKTAQGSVEVVISMIDRLLGL